MATYIERPISLHGVLATAAARSTTPALDFEWEPFKANLREFLTLIDGYASSAKGEIALRAQTHSDLVKQAVAEQADLEKRTTLEREREAQMLAALDLERRTEHDLQATLTHMQTTLSRVKEQSKSLEEELNAVKRAVQTERTEKERQTKALESQRSRDSLELRVLQDILGVRIEGVTQNALLMRFTLIDPNEPEREFSMLIDISSHAYSVPKCEPVISNMPELVDRLNEDRDLYGFIKRVRKGFRATLPAPPPTPSPFDDLSGPGRL